MTNGLLSEIWGNICAFRHKLGNPSSYMLHSEFPYIWGKFDFLFYQCTVLAVSGHWWFRQWADGAVEKQLLICVNKDRLCMYCMYCTLQILGRNCLTKQCIVHMYIKLILTPLDNVAKRLLLENLHYRQFLNCISSNWRNSSRRTIIMMTVKIGYSTSGGAISLNFLSYCNFSRKHSLIQSHFYRPSF